MENVEEIPASVSEAVPTIKIKNWNLCISEEEHLGI